MNGFDHISRRLKMTYRPRAYYDHLGIPTPYLEKFLFEDTNPLFDCQVDESASSTIVL